MLAIILTDTACFLGITSLFKNCKENTRIIIYTLYWLFTLAVITILVWAFFIKTWSRDAVDFAVVYKITNLLFISLNVRLVFCVFVLISVVFSISKVLKKNKLVIKTGAVVSVFLIIILVYGTMYGRFNFKIKNQTLAFKTLPYSFNNLKIVQISDLHLGTLPGHEQEFKKVIEMVNTEKPDLIFITGDIVNCFSEEVEPFKVYLSQLKSKYGSYAVLGNHDYGDYYKWKNKKEIQNDRKQLISYLKQSNIELLLNGHKNIIRGSDTIIIAGIENWGKPPFKQLGDLDEALDSVSRKNFIMLLSHDPIFWSKKVVGKAEIPITFSGHTHGFQLGIWCKNFEWSPFGFMSKMTAGLYQNGNQWLYINRGIGGALYPGRFGIWPEITVFTLHCIK